MISDILNNRTTGHFPVSIATSLAIEGAFGIHPDHPVLKAPILKYNSLWINCRTLFRNLIGSLEKDSIDKITVRELTIVLNEEMSFIRNIISEMTNNTVGVVFYYPNYNKIEFSFKYGVVRMDNTDRQKELTTLHNQTIKNLLDKDKDDKIHGIKIFNISLSTNGDSNVEALLISHYAIDLLSANEFKKLSLLESHTGVIKEKAMWYTKFYNGAELNQIPFIKCFLIIFGDDTTFRPYARSLRMDILEVAKKYNWSSVSTRAKIIYGISSMKNPYAREVLLDML